MFLCCSMLSYRPTGRAGMRNELSPPVLMALSVFPASILSRPLFAGRWSKKICRPISNRAASDCRNEIYTAISCLLFLPQACGFDS